MGNKAKDRNESIQLMTEQLAVNTEVSKGPLTHSRVLALYSFQGSKYSDTDRIRVALCYLVRGSGQKVANDTGIPRRTISQWIAEPWWDELLTELRQQNEPEFQAGFRENIKLALGAVKDRLENGETKLVKGKDGEYVERKVPVGAKDAMIISGISFDKLRLSRGDPTTITTSTMPPNEELRKIARKEIAAARMKKVVSEQ